MLFVVNYFFPPSSILVEVNFVVDLWFCSCWGCLSFFWKQSKESYCFEVIKFWNGKERTLQLYKGILDVCIVVICFMFICFVNFFHGHLPCEFVSWSFGLWICFMFFCYVNFFHVHLLCESLSCSFALVHSHCYLNLSPLSCIIISIYA